MTPDVRAATRSLRLRITAVATVAVAVVLTVTAFVLVDVQRRSLMSGVDEAVEQRADEIGMTLRGGAPRTFAGNDVVDRVVQLVGTDARVLASTPNLAGARPIAPAPRGSQALRDVHGLPFEQDVYRVFSRRVTVDGSPAVLHVAENVDHVEDSVDVLQGSLLVAFPPLVLLVALLTWWLAGRTLRPVNEAAQRQQRFVADASHELRSPLTRIRTRLEVDLAHPGTRSADDSAAVVLAEARAMQRLVDDLLHLARADVGAIEHRRQNVDLDELVLEEARAADAPDGVAVDVSDVSGASVDGDPAQLARLDNAVRHARTTVRLALRESDGSAVLEVSDDGAGIPSERRAEVFERFTRLDAARSSEHGGTGLGLAIARDIAERHRGRITVDDSPGGGARLTVVLPAP